MHIQDAGYNKTLLDMGPGSLRSCMSPGVSAQPVRADSWQSSGSPQSVSISGLKKWFNTEQGVR